ncbi:MAG: rhomboid family intramembrane serine protease [Candidatus Methanospirare jalkutatii]|nr:rhomboid family intramembrane serine protease [Candidatus Methanospirare jalkutatii]
MARCVICGKRAVRRCEFCGDALCEEHLPPEKHYCIAYQPASSAAEGGFEGVGGFEGFEGVKGVEGVGGRKRGARRPIASANLGIFINNFSLLLLILISISFILQLLIPNYTNSLILNPLNVQERPWTLVTHIFLHASFEHFFINMLFLAFFAPVLERAVGSRNFLMVFFLSGIAAGVGWCLTSQSPVLGASGALCGVFGALAVLMPRMRVYFFFFLPMEMWLAAILFALYDFFFAFSGDHIAHTAHLSGLFFGMLAGVMLREKVRSVGRGFRRGF